MNAERVVARQYRTDPRGWVVVVLIAIAGLAYVKWLPYYHKAFAAAAHHSIGTSILTGGADHAPAPSIKAALDYALAYGQAIWKALVLGLLLGSAIEVLLPRAWIAARLGGSGFGCVALGGVLSLPGMMCTCCAAPVVAGLRECRASAGSAVAFWLGNTMLNPATLVFTGFVLGWHWTALRLVVGLVMVFGLGALVNRTAGSAESVRVAAPRTSADPAAREADRPCLRRGLAAFTRMSLRLLPEYFVLVLLLGAARAWLFPLLGTGVDDSLPWILAFALAGAVFVIPTAGEVPIVQALLCLGAGTGPAAALLMTLPPISAPSLAMLWRSLGARTLAIVSGGVIALGVAAGFAAVALFG